MRGLPASSSDMRRSEERKKRAAPNAMAPIPDGVSGTEKEIWDSGEVCDSTAPLVKRRAVVLTLLRMGHGPIAIAESVREPMSKIESDVNWLARKGLWKLRFGGRKGGKK